MDINVAFEKQVEYVASHTENIGVGGLCFLCKRKIEPFKEISLKLFIPDQKMPIECNGKVLWIVERHAAQSDDRLFDVGIEFLNINTHDRNRIKDFISQKERIT